jgi:hypothetical protein
LAPRVEALAGRLREGVHMGDDRERERRSKLERYMHTFWGRGLSLINGDGIRKLNDVSRELELLNKEGNITSFFNNVENADKLGGLVEGIRDAVMDYQVRNYHSDLTSICLISASDYVTTRYLR